MLPAMKKHTGIIFIPIGILCRQRLVLNGKFWFMIILCKRQEMLSG